MATVGQASLFNSDFSWNTDVGFVMDTGKTHLKVCPWFLLLPDKVLKSVLENEKKREERYGYMEIVLYLHISLIGEESDIKFS